MSNKTEQINKKLIEYNGGATIQAQRLERQNRLKRLVQAHDVEHVAQASGLRLDTLKQYLRAKVAPSIAATAVDQAESVLKGL